MTQPIYLVCGLPRSGTSMMMRALDAGGLPAIFDARHDVAMREAVRGDYDPNPHGYYEAVDRRHQRADWATFRGRAIKCFHGELDCLRDGFTYRAVYLWRDPGEIEASHHAIGLKTDFAFLRHYDLDVDNDVAWLRGRGVEVTLLRYPEIIADPAGQLARLGWPIDVDAAAAVVDASLYRHRLATTSNPFLAAALDYAARGWHVGRCRAGTKHHLAGYYDHTTDPQKLAEWWTAAPDANLNISTGLVSGVVSIDIDGPAGLAWWRERYGDSTGPTIWTPRGMHLLFRCDRPTPSVLLHPEIDLYADDGQTMMPPSVHPSGQRYEWIVPPDVPLQPLPPLNSARPRQYSIAATLPS